MGGAGLGRRGAWGKGERGKGGLGSGIELVSAAFLPHVFWKVKSL